MFWIPAYAGMTIRALFTSPSWVFFWKKLLLIWNFRLLSNLLLC